jgi:hypothetical protein
MTEPSGRIIARPMLPRACGCIQEFQHYERDKYRAQRQEKFQRTRCPACAEKLAQENAERQRQEAAAIPKKGELMKMLPVGTQIALQRRSDGSWAGIMVADGTRVEAEGEGSAGVINTLARLWVVARLPAAAPKPPA